MNQVCNQFRNCQMGSASTVKQLKRSTREGLLGRAAGDRQCTAIPPEGFWETITGQIQRKHINSRSNREQCPPVSLSGCTRSPGTVEAPLRNERLSFHLARFAYSSIIYGGMTFGAVGALIYTVISIINCG